MFTVNRADGWGHVEKEVSVCVPGKAEPRRRAWAQEVGLGGDAKQRAWGKGRVRQRRGRGTMEVHHVACGGETWGLGSTGTF